MANQPNIAPEVQPDGSVAFRDKTTNKIVFKLPSAAEIEATRADATKMLAKARAHIVLQHPFFSTIMLKRPFRERLSVPTLAVDQRGNIYYNPFFIKALTLNQVIWAVCHEVMHYASGHPVRRGNRDPKLWNVAGDRWINDMLNREGIGEKIPGCEDVPGSSDMSVEQIYRQLQEQQQEQPQSGKGKKGQGGQKGKGQRGEGDDDDGEGNGPGDHDPMAEDLMDGDGESGKPLDDAELAEAEAQRKLDTSEAAAAAKVRGKLPGRLAEFASATVESKTPWYSILEKFMTDRVKQDYSWARPNRRYAPDYYLPVVDGVGAMGEIVLQVDISGSVSQKEIEHYNGHIKRIVEQCRPNKVHVIYTDTQVQKHEVFEKPEDVEIRFYSGGGTHMPAGYGYVKSQGIEPVVFVTLTDGYTGWDSDPGFPTVHCISSDQTAPYGVNVKFDLE